MCMRANRSRSLLMRHLELFVAVAVHEGNVILQPDCGMCCSNIIELPTLCSNFSLHAHSNQGGCSVVELSLLKPQLMLQSSESHVVFVY